MPHSVTNLVLVRTLEVAVAILVYQTLGQDPMPWPKRWSWPANPPGASWPSSAPPLDHAARLKVSRAFERVLVPHEKRRRGRKRDATITAAVADYEAGMRGQGLYQKHIRGYSGMGRYRRQSAIRTLNESIRSRRRRDQAGPATNSPA